jgi:hypothetical protein
MNNELKEMWKVTVVDQFVVRIRFSLRGKEERQAEVWNWYLPNTKQEYCHPFYANSRDVSESSGTTATLMLIHWLNFTVYQYVLSDAALEIS